jgi:septal ring factor EnvC (AmiA/AmiB activator)
MYALVDILVASGFSGVVMTVVTWIFTRRKNKADATASELDNVEKAIKIWRELSDELETRMTKEINELRAENKNLRNKIKEIAKENENMRSHIDCMDRQLKSAQETNKELQRKLEKYNAQFK